MNKKGRADYGLRPFFIYSYSSQSLSKWTAKLRKYF